MITENRNSSVFDLEAYIARWFLLMPCLPEAPRKWLLPLPTVLFLRCIRYMYFVEMLKGMQRITMLRC